MSEIVSSLVFLFWKAPNPKLSCASFLKSPNCKVIYCVPPSRPDFNIPPPEVSRGGRENMKSGREGREGGKGGKEGNEGREGTKGGREIEGTEGKKH